MNKQLKPECPYCNGAMRPEKMRCVECGVAVEGDFSLPRLARLPAEDAAFLAEYVLSGFSIKEMEKRVGLSYPAIRSRLDRVKQNLESISISGKGRRQQILDRVERGELKADEAIQMIEALRKEKS